MENQYSKTNLPPLDMVLEAIKNSFGIKETICQKIGCDRPTLEAAIKKSVLAKEMMEVEREKKTDLAEKKLIERVEKKGDLAGIKVLLWSSEGRKRGYGEENQDKKPKPNEGSGSTYAEMRKRKKRK